MDAITKPKKKPPPSVSPSYPDLHDHIRALDKAGLLITVDRPINKDTEMHPLVRWQFRGGIAERDRKAFLFTNVIDAKGRRYDIPVLVGGLAANREIYRIGEFYASAEETLARNGFAPNREPKRHSALQRAA